MNSADWSVVTQIFSAALEKPPSVQKDFVHQECKGDPALEAAVLKLLEADDKAGSFLEGPALTTRTAKSPVTSSTSPRLSPGRVLSERFEIVHFIGQGGMGQVYEALDLELKTRVALKAIRPDIACDEQVLSRFKREVLLTRRITHPNVCRTFDIDRHNSASGGETDSNVTFLTMELLEGQTLADLLQHQSRLTTAEARPLVFQMIEALNAAHSVGIVHRDFKPSNVLIVPSQSGTRVVVTDFGLARAVVPDTQVSIEQHTSVLTGAGGMVGTLVYMAPEQFERGEATVASDMYALGLVMYEMVTGQRPFADPIAFAEAAKRLKQPAPSAKLFVPELDGKWEAAICKCLQLQPKERFESVLQVAEQIAVGDKDLPNSRDFRAPRSRKPEDTETWVTLLRNVLRRKWAIAAVVLLLIVSLFGIVSRYYIRRASKLPFGQRDWILVTDFANQTGEKVFDRVVRDLVVQSLSQSSYLNIVPRLTALEAAKRTGVKDVSSIDEKVGRELCLRENYKALLTGEILKSGSGYILAMRVTVPARGVAAISDTESFQSPGELFAGVDRLTARVRQKLGESLSSVQSSSKALAQVTTPSLDALQRYSSAVDLYGAREYTRSIALADDAVERDPSFAMAHLLLARAYEQLGNEKQSSKQFEMALASQEAAGERERHLIQATYYSSVGLNQKAADEYQHLLDIYPDDVDSLRGLAEASFWAGHPDKAASSLQRVVSLDPNDVANYDALISILIRTNRFDEALAAFRAAQSRKIDTANLRFLAALASWGNDDLDSARRGIISLKEEDSDYWKVVSTLFTGKLLAYRGHMQEAAGTFRDGLALVRREGWENWVPTFQYQLARAELTRGLGEVSKRECREYARTAKKVPIAGNLQRAGRLFIEIGDLNAAREVLRLVDKAIRSGADPFSEMERYSLAGDIERASGRSWAAVRSEQKAIGFVRSFEPYLSLGEACEQAKDWNCATHAYQQYIQQKGEILRDDVAQEWALAHSRLARTYAESGDPTSALFYYRKFADLFSAGDEDLPSVVVARKELAAFEAGATN